MTRAPGASSALSLSPALRGGARDGEAVGLWRLHGTCRNETALAEHWRACQRHFRRASCGAPGPSTATRAPRPTPPRAATGACPPARRRRGPRRAPGGPPPRRRRGTGGSPPCGLARGGTGGGGAVRDGAGSGRGTRSVRGSAGRAPSAPCRRDAEAEGGEEAEPPEAAPPDNAAAPAAAARRLGGARERRALPHGEPAPEQGGPCAARAGIGRGMSVKVSGAVTSAVASRS